MITRGGGVAAEDVGKPIEKTLAYNAIIDDLFMILGFMSIVGAGLLKGLSYYCTF